MTVSRLVIAIATMAVSAFASAQVQKPLVEYSYYARVAGSNTTCANEASALLTRLQANKSLSSVSATCAPENTIEENGVRYKSYSIVVKYIATDRQPIESARIGGVDVNGNSNGSGLFNSYGACVAQLPTQKALFEVNTGLQAVTATCTREIIPEQAPYSYAILIEGLGEGQSSLQAYGISYIYEDSMAVKQMMYDVFAHYRTPLAYQSKGSFLYYSAAPIPVSQDTLMVTRSAAECVGQLQDAKAILTNAGSEAGEVACITNSDYKYEIFSLVLVQGGGHKIREAYAAQPVTYMSYAECVADKARVVSEATSENQPIYGAICDNEVGEYKMHLYSK